MSFPAAGGMEMWSENGRWRCELCGAVIDAPVTMKPRVVYYGYSGVRSVRVLRVDRREVHRCVMRP